jgi:hypothetical protein
MKSPARGSGSQNTWLEGLRDMGGQFWPPELEEEDMPEVGAKYPMMLYEGERQCIVYDDEEYEEALANGFKEHPSKPQGTSPPGGQKPPEPPEEVKPPPVLPPQVRDVPYLSQTGDLLTCTMGNWTGEPDSYKYQFRRDTSTLVGTESNEYVVTPADVGRSLDCVVEATNAAGKGSSTSNAVVVVEPGTPEQAPAQQRGSVTVEKKVTVTPPPRSTPMSPAQAQTAAATAPAPPKPPTPAPRPPTPPPAPAVRTVPPPVSVAKPPPPKK